MRKQDWPERLDLYIRKAKDKPFKFGKMDCCSFAADAVKVMTDVDIFKQYKGKYKSYKEATKFIKGHFIRVVDKAMSKNGFKQIIPRRAQRGDVCIVKSGRRNIAGICIGRYVLAPGQNGLLSFSILDVKCAWRIH